MKQRKIDRNYVRAIKETPPEEMTVRDAAQSLKSKSKEEYNYVNILFHIVYHLLLASDTLFAEIEDLMTEKGKFRYTIKRKHKEIAGKIHDEYAPMYKQFGVENLGYMYEDQLELLNVLKAWAGVIKGKKVELTDIPTEGEAMTIQKHKVTSDYLLRNGDGWTMTVPKAMHDTCVKMSRELKEELNDNLPHPVGVKIWVGKEKEEEPINND